MLENGILNSLKNDTLTPSPGLKHPRPPSSEGAFLLSAISHIRLLWRVAVIKNWLCYKQKNPPTGFLQSGGIVLVSYVLTLQTKKTAPTSSHSCLPSIFLSLPPRPITVKKKIPRARIFVRPGNIVILG